ncbi:prefoldin subunit 6 isoform X2 [Agrilus planipennis]|uniref:Probable prefoldin subunit 6 n=1 Tax=Agrilus planipennis TaxID=224129 RepID=A0A1W4WI65_AGRPL|nr:prefoldin subunit 6 isoform X1 [Agrilus planipennis]XP_025829396.1 prefoldin subunit 6 isoform X2 [Agrilus planipennis]
MEDMQKKIQSELDSFKLVQKEYQKAISNRQQLDAQLNENQIVKGELDILSTDSVVYKSVGPILIKTDITEARQNVEKRMDFINKELKRVDDHLTELEKKQNNHRESLNKLQQQFQQAHVKAAMRA